jgi:hypothetical protein
MIKPSSTNVCAQFEKPWLKIHGNTTNRIPTNPIPKIVNKAMINIFSFMISLTLLPAYLKRILTDPSTECKGWKVDS